LRCDKNREIADFKEVTELITAGAKKDELAVKGLNKVHIGELIMLYEEYFAFFH